MCGIVGIISSYKNGLSTDEADAFTDMLFVDTLRGFDSTGVFAVDNVGNVEGLKAAMQGPNFIRTQDYAAFRTSCIYDGLFVVGHNRAATRGSVSDKNAHPFNVDNKIVLVQNGTYRGSHKHLKDTEVDTEAIAHVIAEEPDVEKALQKVDAAYTLVWYDVDNKTMNIIRNDERPLYLAYLKEGGGAIFASEETTILFAAGRNKLKLQGPPFLIDSKQLVTWKIMDGGKKEHKATKNLDIDYKAPIIPKSESSSVSNYSNEEYWEKLMRPTGEQTRIGAAVETFSRDNYRNDPKSVLKCGMEWFTSINCEGAWLTIQEAKTVQDYLIDNTGPNKKHLISLYSYLPANDLKGCRTWYVIGTSLDCDQYELPSPLYYQVVYDVPEHVVEKMVEHEYYHATVGSPVEYLIPATDAHPQAKVISVSISSINKVDVHETSENPQ